MGALIDRRCADHNILAGSHPNRFLEVSVLRASLADTIARSLVVAFLVALPATIAAQNPTPASAPTQQAAPVMSKDEISAFAKLQVAISKVQDSAQAQLAQQ